MVKTPQDKPAPIAIVGMGSIFPGRGDATGFWQDVFEGRDLLSEVPETHWLIDDYYDSDPRAPDRTYGRRGGFIDPVAFDPMAFGISPKAMEATDSAQMLALIAAKMTLDDIERDSGGLIDKSRTSVILGVASATELTAHMAGRLQRPTWINAMRDAGLPETQVQDLADRISAHYSGWQEATFPGLLGNVVAGRIANRFDLGGSNYVTDAACASSLAALQIALHELRLGDSDTVLVGGVDALNDILMYMCFSKTPALSPTGDCRPFSQDADGTMLSEGIGMLALRRLDIAERDGNTIHAVIRGLGGGSDGAGTAVYAPLASGQARALSRAYAQAGYGPADVDLVEAHGTGTVAGDRAEIEGLHLVFEAEAGAEPWCALGSIKSQMGHAKGAAGAASLTKVTQALSRKILPPTIKVDQPAEALVESPVFYLNTQARPWVTSRHRPRRAAVSSFGFGGSNFHVTLEEYAGKNKVKPYRVLPSELFLFSADTAQDLADKIETVTSEDLTDPVLAATASESHSTFDHDAPARASIVANSAQDLRDKAHALAVQIRDGGLKTRPLKPGCAASIAPAEPGKVAFVFSGQGSQYVDMGAGLAMAFPAALSVWDKAVDHPITGPLRLDRLSFPPAASDQVEYGDQLEALTKMQHAQPAIAAVALSQLALLKQLGVKATAACGHSFGEVMALHYGGAFTANQALTIAAERGAHMNEASAKASGSMIAVQASHVASQSIIDEVGSALVLANDNSPDQIVLSGPVEAIRKALEVCKAKGLKARQLPVASAFHTPIMEGAVEPFQNILDAQKMKALKIPVYANATAKKYAGTAKTLPKKLASQIVAPVRFREQIEAMYAGGARTFVEVGPGAVLTGLIGNILAGQDHLAVPLDHKKRDGVTQFFTALGQLSVAGVKLNMARLLRDLPAAPIKEPSSKYAIMISGANHAKPYPPPSGSAGRAEPNLTVPAEPRLPPLDTVSSKETETMTKQPQKEVAQAIANTSLSITSPSGQTMSERIWQDVSQRHSEFLATMTAAHNSYLSAAVQFAGSQAVAMPAPAPLPAQAVAPLITNSAPAPAPIAHSAAPAVAPSAPPTAVAAAADPMAAAPGTTAKPAVIQEDPTSLVKSIIARQTGYPVDMLEADMDLEGELGVDSIKQVEILSTLQTELPGLPELGPEELGELRTIRAIATMIETRLGGVAPPQANGHDHDAAPVSVPAPASAAPPPVNGAASVAISADTVKALIAEKTGYPVDMLEDEMDLEGELGVDSIKQVEILSALRDQNPSLPEVEPEVLAELRTIKAIADFFA